MRKNKLLASERLLLSLQKYPYFPEERMKKGASMPVIWDTCLTENRIASDTKHLLSCVIFLSLFNFTLFIGLLSAAR